MRALNLWVVGGDQRQDRLAEMLAEDGHRVHTYALDRAEEPRGTVMPAGSLEKIGKADCVILPLPAVGEEGMLSTPLTEERVRMTDLLDAMRPGQLMAGGRLDRETILAAQARGLLWRDYFAREELAIANAIPTAEGAIQLAMENLPITIHACRVLVVGYGRVGRTLADRLRGLGAFVSVAARRYEQLAWAEADGCTAQRLGDMRGWLCGYDLIINTVPARVLTEELLGDLKPSCLVIDVASKPGGVDVGMG